jgi:XisI protein
MERIIFMEKILLEVITEYLLELRQPVNQNIQFASVVDAEKKHYQVVAMGWEGYKRIFNLLFHIDIITDKIWIQEDKMEYSIAERLVKKGISKKEIVLGYFPDYHRAYTEYAVS